MNTQNKQGDLDPAKVSLMVSVPEAARLLGIGRTCAWDMVRSGDLPTRRFRKRVLVPRAAVELLAGIREPALTQDIEDLDALLDDRPA